MLKYFDILMLISAIPLFVFLVDGFYKKKMNTAINYIILFIVIAAITGLLILYFKLYFALAIPVILIGLIVFSEKNIVYEFLLLGT